MSSFVRSLVRRPLFVAVCAISVVAPPLASQCPAAYTYEGFHQERVGTTLASQGEEAVFGGIDPGTGHFERWGDDRWNRTYIYHSQLAGTVGIAGSCDLRGDLCVFGSPGNNALGTTPYPHGSCSFFERSPGGNWTLVFEPLPPIPVSEGGFGASIGISQDGARVFVGEMTYDGAGEVHVYQRQPSGWALETTLTAPWLGASARFGWAVEHVAGRLFVSAPGWAGDPSHTEQIVVFDQVAGVWTAVDILTSGLPQHISFGQVIDGGGMRLVVGASGYQGPGVLGSGLVAEYDLSQPGWQFAPTILAPRAGVTVNGFGRALDLSGDRLAIGASSRAFEYRRTAGTWSEFAEVLPGVGSFGPFFGWAVALAERGLLVGDTGYDENLGYPESTGGVHYFDLTDQGERFLACGSGIALEFGGRVEMRVDWPARAGEPFRVLGSITGEGPTLVQGVSVPLAPDAYTGLLQSFPGSAPFLPGGVGVLDAQGSASLAFEVPSGLSLALDGLAIHHAAIVFPAAGAFDVTNSVTTTLVRLF